MSEILIPSRSPSPLMLEPTLFAESLTFSDMECKETDDWWRDELDSHDNLRPEVHVALVEGSYFDDGRIPDYMKMKPVTWDMVRYFMWVVHREMQKRYPCHTIHLHTYSGSLSCLTACELFLHTRARYEGPRRFFEKDDPTMPFLFPYRLTIHYHRMQMQINAFTSTWMNVESLLVEKMMVSQQLGARIEFMETYDQPFHTATKCGYDFLKMRDNTKFSLIFCSPFDGFTEEDFVKSKPDFTASRLDSIYTTDDFLTFYEKSKELPKDIYSKYSEPRPSLYFAVSRRFY